MGSASFSRDDLLEFLKQSGINGIINPATARSRRTAAEQLLIELNDEEAQDLRQLDVDDLCARLHKLQGRSIRSETLTLYNSRLKAALNDYIAWLEDPQGFVATGGENRQLRKRAERGTHRSVEEQALEAIRLSEPQQTPDIVPVAIRSNHVVYVHNLPSDLSPDEAAKLTRVIQAFATPAASNSKDPS